MTDMNVNIASLKCLHDPDCPYESQLLCLCVKRELINYSSKVLRLETENGRLQAELVKLKNNKKETI